MSNTPDEDNDDTNTAETINASLANIEEQFNALVNDIFSSNEFIGFIERLQQSLPNDDVNIDEYEDDDDDDLSSPLDLDVEYNYFIDTITFGRPLTPPVPTPIEFVHYPYETKDGKQEECSICLIDFETNDNVVSLKCNHLFHQTCIVEWSNHKAECPNCREKI
jgi:hypothetical protein